MTVITDSNHKVYDIALIPGLEDWESHGYHVYFPVDRNELPNIGDYYKPVKTTP